MRRAAVTGMLDGPGSEPDYSGPMPADVADRLEAGGEEILIARETRESGEKGNQPAETGEMGADREA